MAHIYKQELEDAVTRASSEHSKALAAFKAKTGDYDNLQAAAAMHQHAINQLDGYLRCAYAIEIRRDAAIRLDHAIARLGYWNYNGQCDRDAVHLIQNAKWSLEAMDSPASNRFWSEQRQEYNAMLMELREGSAVRE